MTLGVTSPEWIALPRPPQAAWWLVVAVGTGTLLLGGSELAQAPLSAPSTAYLTAGIGLFLSAFASLMLAAREPPITLVLHPEALAIEEAGEPPLLLEWGRFREVSVLSLGNQHDHAVALRSRRGGLLEVATFSDEDEARHLAARLGAHLHDRTPEDDPLATLRGRLAVGDEPDTLTLRWSTAPRALGAAAALLPVGLMSIAYGFQRHAAGSGGGGLVVGLGVLAALLLLAWALRLGDRAELRLTTSDAGQPEFSLRRYRLGRVTTAVRVAVGEIGAADYSHRLNLLGAGAISLRGPVTADASVVAGVAQAMAAGRYLSVARLPLATRLALALAVDERTASGEPAQPPSPKASTASAT
ncbi:MAG: hypothetical protein R3B72_12625 [Polyangiaceae bacterium]